MAATKADIIAQLRREILPLQGIRTAMRNPLLDKALGPIRFAFPGASFPLGAVHEFLYNGAEDCAASSGFISAIISSLMADGAVIWISASQNIFPPALRSFGLSPEKIIFIQLKKDKEILWAMEEAIKCKGLSAVVAEMKELNFVASRRLQLAVEQSGVTGFVMRGEPRIVSATACLTRWKISATGSDAHNEMPGLGFPRWNIELMKVRNGTPGMWQAEFAGGRLRLVSRIAAMPVVERKKAG